MTAAETVAPGKIPQVDSAALSQTKQAAGMINTALQHMGLGPDPWKAIVVGVAPTKPHTAVRVFEASAHACALQRAAGAGACGWSDVPQ